MSFSLQGTWFYDSVTLRKKVFLMSSLPCCFFTFKGLPQFWYVCDHPMPSLSPIVLYGRPVATFFDRFWLKALLKYGESQLMMLYLIWSTVCDGGVQAPGPHRVPGGDGQVVRKAPLHRYQCQTQTCCCMNGFSGQGLFTFLFGSYPVVTFMSAL